MKVIRADTPYATNISYKAGGPSRKSAICLDGRFSLNTGGVYEFSIEVDAADNVTTVTECTNIKSGAKYLIGLSYLSRGQVIHILEEHWGVTLPEWMWCGFSNPYVEAQNVFVAPGLFDYLINLDDFIPMQEKRRMIDVHILH